MGYFENFPIIISCNILVAQKMPETLNLCPKSPSSTRHEKERQVVKLCPSAGASIPEWWNFSSSSAHLNSLYARVMDKSGLQWIEPITSDLNAPLYDICQSTHRKRCFSGRSTTVVLAYDPRAWESLSGMEWKNWQRITVGVMDVCAAQRITAGVVGTEQMITSWCDNAICVFWGLGKRAPSPRRRIIYPDIDVGVEEELRDYCYCMICTYQIYYNDSDHWSWSVMIP